MTETIPLFKTCYSQGRSILNLDESSDPESSDSIFQIAKDEGLKEVVLVEDSMGGFLQAYKNANKLGIKLIFGLRLSFVNDVNAESAEKHNSSHKNIIFIKSKSGYQKIIDLYSRAATQYFNNEPQVDYQIAKEVWSDKDLSLVIPFYDSYLMNNMLTDKTCIPDLFCEPTFFQEDNNHPFDFLINDKINSFANQKQSVKSVYYRNKKDFRAYQTFRCLTSRKFGNKTLSNPNLELCCSNDFCIEALK